MSQPGAISDEKNTGFAENSRSSILADKRVARKVVQLVGESMLFDKRVAGFEEASGFQAISYFAFSRLQLFAAKDKVLS